MNVRAAILRILPVLMAIGIFSAVPAQAQDDITVEATLNRDTIGLDEQVLLEVKIEGKMRNLPPPQIPTLSKFDVYDQGQSTNISIVNGQMSSTVSYRYILIPSEPGSYPIENISVVYNNRRYKADPVTLTVLSKGTAGSPPAEAQGGQGQSSASRDYFLTAEVDRKSPYVNQQVTLTLKFYIAVRHSTPDLTWPTTTGFWRESISSNTAYSQRVSNRTYKVYEVKSALFPTQTGELTIGRAMITTRVATDFFFAGDQITARSSPITINVRPLPQEGKPADFSGTVGDFKMSLRTDKASADVNQPVTVTVRIDGTGNIKSVAEPKIPETEEFRVYRASSKENITKTRSELGGTKIFEEVFIPRRPGNLEIPALSLSFFNPKSGKYEKVSTRPIPLTVRETEGYASSDDVPYAAGGMTISSQAQDIRYIKENLGDLQKVGTLIIAKPIYLAVNGLPVLALLGLIVYRVRREKLSSDIGYARSRAASRMARKRLAQARSLARTDSAGDFYAEISQAVTSYVADKLNISPYGLTSDRISELLRERGADNALVTETVDILQRSDFARFAPSSVTEDDIRQSLERAEDVMVKMEGVKFA